jgi:poly [ADP-ribose] polymerase
MLWLALAHLLLGTSLTLDSREFQAEYAKSGRAACKKCKVAIAKDSLRLARLVKSSHFDGVTPQWHHFSCLFKTNHWCSTEDDVIGFDNLRYEDQQRLETAMKEKGPSLKKKQASGGNFLLEYAKSSRSKCKSCGEKIMKEELRLGKMIQSDSERFSGMVPAWHHRSCFFKRAGDDWKVGSLEDFTGWQDATEEDRLLLKTLIAGGDPEKLAALAVDLIEGGEASGGSSSSSSSSSSRNKASKSLRDKTSNLKVGTKVLVFWADDKEWFKGTIAEERKGGKFLVKYEDGDTDEMHPDVDDYRVLADKNQDIPGVEASMTGVSAVYKLFHQEPSAAGRHFIYSLRASKSSSPPPPPTHLTSHLRPVLLTATSTCTRLRTGGRGRSASARCAARDRTWRHCRGAGDAHCQ